MCRRDIHAYRHKTHTPNRPRSKILPTNRAAPNPPKGPKPPYIRMVHFPAQVGLVFVMLTLQGGGDIKRMEVVVER